MDCIIADWKEYIRITPMPEDLKRALHSDHKYPKFLENVARELKAAKKVDRATIKMTTYSIAEWFVNMIKHKANERLMSELEVSRRNIEYDKKQELMKEANAYADTVKVEAIKKESS